MHFAHELDRLQAPDRTTSAPSPATSPERLKALAEQFESMLVSQMLQEMRKSMFEDGEGEKSALAPLSDTLFSELSLAISRAGGVGFAESITTPLMSQTDGAFAAAPTAPPSEAPLSPSLPMGRVSSAYGWRRDPIDASLKFHKGLDIAMPVGQAIPAPQAGTVVFAGEMPGYGTTVVLDHGNNLTTRYAHLSSVEAQVGDRVSSGQVIARSGASGRVTGPHLHFEVLESGKPVNPEEKLATYAAGRPQ
jgi:murein DD-endopeptidase MepM/ murein hydrolase activator NlpD